MRITRGQLVPAAVVLTIVASLGVATLAAKGPPLVDKIRIEIDNMAKSDGEILFTFTPSGGEARKIRVTVAKKMTKKEIARDLAKELTVAVGDGYKVERTEGDRVRIERKKNAKFTLTLDSNNVNGISVTLK